MYCSLDASSKQLTHFFDVQKNLSFSLENNNTINTYIHPNDKEPVRFEPISPLLIYNVTFLKFEEKESMNWKNNYSTSDWSGYTSDNSPFNSPPVLTKIKNTAMPFSSVFLAQESKQHLDLSNVFFLLLSLFTQPLTVDFPIDNSTDTFKNLLLHFVYDSSSSPSFLFIYFFSH
jgi:hypothetical protein